VRPPEPEIAAGELRPVACRRCGCRELLAVRIEERNGRRIRRGSCRHCGAAVSTVLGIRTDIGAEIPRS
jgi:hypothetical protein